MASSTGNSSGGDGREAFNASGYDEAVAQASAELFENNYDELLAIARRLRRRRSLSETLNTTTLVHEAFLRLSQKRQFVDDQHFFASVTLAIRHTLIDHARKGGDNAAPPEAIGDGIEDMDIEGDNQLSPEDVIAVRQGLEFIAEHDPRLVRVVDCRYFVGLTLEETALVLDMNEKTVRRDWVKARAMLRSHLASGQTTRMPD